MTLTRIIFVLLTLNSIDSEKANILDVDQDDGGWFTDEKDKLAYPGPCDIEVRDAAGLSQEEFLQRYAFHAPVVIRGATDNKIFQNKCRKDAMMNKYASKRITLSSANTHSYTKAEVTLEHYVEHVMKPQSLETWGNGKLYNNESKSNV
ncbi:jmjC domain-containing protein 8-like [Elysia marginata]|uniref:JmjC domain-containing protein 8-like n=1 Tax=Elysia marginata TaxID=1093978 RepID=A0AAV4GXD5_9GAST|nr:jmjC domain-containing protein 8-like [Elysia marginata]